MSSISCAGISYVDSKANRIRLDALLVSAAAVRNVIRLIVVALTGALLAACAQSSRYQKFRAGWPQSTRVAATQSNGITSLTDVSRP